jgi:hypothetical protein
MRAVFVIWQGLQLSGNSNKREGEGCAGDQSLVQSNPMISLVIGSSSARRPSLQQPSPLAPNPGFPCMNECGLRNLTWSDIGHLSTWHTILPRLWRCGLTCYSNARAQKGQHTCSRSPNPGEATLSPPLQTRPLKRFKETLPRNVCLFP